MRRRWRGDTIRRWVPVAAWLAVISTFSSGWFSGAQTGAVLLPVLRWLFPSATYSQLVLAHMVIRKLAHVLEYLVLSLLLYRALDGRAFARSVALRALALAALCAAADELHQSFVAGRTAAVKDCLIDVTGAAAGLGLLALRARAVMTRAPARP
jgi:VanZ family protein